MSDMDRAVTVAGKAFNNMSLSNKQKYETILRHTG